ncbi:phosphoenolpyruvate carboxykinase, partial [Rhodococcus hoagii]|nr:phosphoenolpyruvate carboxykinase [Prescottella equi]
MTSATIPGLNGTDGTPPTEHSELLAWVREVAELTQPDRVVFADGSDEEWERLTDQLVEAGRSPSQRGEEAELVPRQLRSVRRRARRVPHLHLLREADRRRPHQQLDGPGRDADPHDGSVPRQHAWSHLYVVPFCMGPLGAEDPKLGVEITGLRVRRRL